MKDADREVAAIAERQFGAVSRRQAAQAGLKEAAMTRRVVTGRWVVVLPGVYRSAGAPPTPHQRAIATVLWAGPKSALSYTSGAWLLQLVSTQSHPLHVTRPPSSTKADPAVVVHRSALQRGDIVDVDGNRCTSATRTIIDCAALLTDEALEAAFEHARRMGLTSPAALARRAGELCGKGRPGSARVRRVLSAQSPGERAMESRRKCDSPACCARARSRPRRDSTRLVASVSTSRGPPCESRASATDSNITGPDSRGSATARGSPRSRRRDGGSST
jgi:hypothetical protein